ncbi:MAG: hypothetical protein ACRD4R_17080 [Candidatus Acidiferrales bacterium]
MSTKSGVVVTRPPINWTSVIVGGFFAGVIGGILMGVAATLWSGAAGLGASTPWEAIAATFYGPLAFVGAAGVTTIGVLLHLSFAAGFGVVFSVLAAKFRHPVKLFFWGILYGTAVWALMTWVFVPNFDATLGARLTMIPVMWFFLHWIYGAFTGLFIPPMRSIFRPRIQVQPQPLQGHQAAA